MKDGDSAYDYDLFVLGAGSGGVRASRWSARLGARVAVAEKRYLGGTCVNVGCVPKKLFVYAARTGEDLRHADGFGFSVGDPSFVWRTLVRNKDREIERLNGVYRKLLADSGVDLFEGSAQLVDAHTVAVDGRKFTAANILIAVGSWPNPLQVEGGDLAVTSNEMFHLEELPKRAAIYGGGYVAVEFASILNGLGVETTLLYRGPLFLRGFDREVCSALAEEMIKKGIALCFERKIEKIERDGESLVVTSRSTSDAGADVRPLEVDLVLSAIGRSPETSSLGLEEAGVELDSRGAVVVDEFGRGSVDSIFAIGDASDRGLGLTPVAIHEGMCLAETLFGDRPTAPDRDGVPTAIFTLPTVGTVGWSEEKARSEGRDIEVFRTRFRPLQHTLTGNSERILMKVIVDRDTDRLLGVHVLGPDAGEILQGFAVALKMGATKRDLDQTVGIHPTSAEELVTMR